MKWCESLHWLYAGTKYGKSKYNMSINKIKVYKRVTIQFVLFITLINITSAAKKIKNSISQMINTIHMSLWIGSQSFAATVIICV